MKTSDVSLARKAGKIITGFDAVVREMTLKKYKFIAAFASSDISEKTFKELNFFTGKHGIKSCKTEISSEELSPVFGKKVAVFAVTDENFYRLFTK